MPKECLICGLQVPEYHWGQAPGARVQCKRCGTYLISEFVAHELHERLLFPEAYRITWPWSGAIREQSELGAEPVIRRLAQLDSMVSIRKDPIESINRLLLYVYRKSSSANEMVLIDPHLDYPVAYAKDHNELKYFLRKAVALGYLEDSEDSNSLFRLDMKGWEKVAELQSKQGRPNQAFVAMWFAPAMDEAFEHGIKKALDATGYDPLRIDMREHNDKIDDRMISEIRKSGLLIADFTGQRGGVYFEAGFAMGLGIPVIWTCREDEVEKLHFDTRQYNHIVWIDPDDLREKLQYRIEATHPRRNRWDGGQ